MVIVFGSSNLRLENLGASILVSFAAVITPPYSYGVAIDFKSTILYIQFTNEGAKGASIIK
jgi:hypothetical protein